MKKTISLLLCVVMLLSVFSVCAVAAEEKFDPATFFTVKKTAHKDDLITFTVYVKAGKELSGVAVKSEFNPADLKPVKADKCTYTGPDDEEYPYFSGFFEGGPDADYANRYNIGYVNTDNVSAGKNDKPFCQFVFKAVNAERPETNVSFYVSGLIGKGENNDNENLVGDDEKFATVSVKTLGMVKLTKIGSVKGGLKIFWDETPGATKYRVYKEIDGAYTKLADVTGTSFIDSASVEASDGVKNNVKYTYTVKALNDAGASELYDKKGISFRYFDSPSTITVKNGANSVVINWSKVEGATYYNIFKRVIKVDGSKGDFMTVAKKVTALTYTDTESLKSNNTFEYTVRSYGKDGNSDDYVYKKITYVGTPAVKVKSTYDGVKVSWGAVAGATKYKIYRKVSGGEYEAITSVKSSVTSFVDKKAPNNKKLVYTVKAYIGSTASGTKGVAVNYLKAPDAKVGNTASGVKISWGKISGAKQYLVYRKAGSAKDWTKIATLKSSVTSYVDKNVKSGTKYTYTVKAYNGSFNSAYNTSGDALYFVSSPKLSSAVSSKTGITLKWNKISGATGYIVYRKTGSGDYEKIVKLTDVSKIKYVDKSAKKGTTYTYKVYAYKGSCKSAASNAIALKDKY